ncbi:hypothetical protein TSOC_006777 [Tetrabaena socialis]|uniref:Uncharacterized protein n=1 Tax=Tetrabaena socialis TaxID=47790 RepID=A0A2J8A2R9_9CHLO|nr:hypothetical protein TSOC_006777 [Tetrabaena socialis]|eukprot:PNH06814.1 hypothetical protein TSOC_006777 [Tetrabaena socialis]
MRSCDPTSTSRSHIQIPAHPPHASSGKAAPPRPAAPLPSSAAAQARSAATSSSVNTGQLRAYLAKAPPPTVKCCTATVRFNNAYCSCSPAVLDLIKSFTNNNINQYVEVAKYLEARCKGLGKPFKLYYGATCPKTKKP